MSIRKLRSSLGTLVLVSLFALSILPVFHLIAVVFINGVSVIASNFPGFFYQERPLPGSEDVGGVGPYILGTLVLVSLATIIAVPISILAAIYTTQSVRSKLGPVTSTLVRAMIEFPTIIVGLSVYGSLKMLDDILSLFGLHSPIPRFSALSGAIALAIVMIPFIYTQVEDGLRSVPTHLREAIYSLGSSRIKASMVMMRYIKATVITAIAIGVGKAMGETAPLLFTAFGSDLYPPTDPGMLLRPIGSLTLGIYNMALSGYDNWIRASWGAALILLSMSIALFVISRIFSLRR